MTRLQWALVTAGALLCAVGVVGLLVGGRTDPVRVAVLLVGSALLHDLVLVPLVLLTHDHADRVRSYDLIAAEWVRRGN